MALVVACLLFAIEVFVLDGWVLFLFSFAVPVSILVSGKGNQPVRSVLEDRRGMRLLGAWALAFLAVLGAISANEAVAEMRGREIAKACREYRQQTGRFPSTLSDLVPGYLPAIPRAKFVMGTRWRYRAPNAATELVPQLTLDARTYSGWRSFDFSTDTLQEGPAW